MSTSDDEFTDDLEQDEEIEEVPDDVAEAQGDQAEGDEGEGATVVAAKVDPTLDEEAQLRTVSSRDSLRQQLENEIKRFLSSGGHIEQLAADDTQKS